MQEMRQAQKKIRKPQTMSSYHGGFAVFFFKPWVRVAATPKINLVCDAGHSCMGVPVLEKGVYLIIRFQL